MGLDISAYSRLERIAGNDEELGDLLYPNSDFIAQADGIKDGRYQGHLELSFRAGSYSGYNRWREELARMVGTSSEKVWHDPRPGPFVELINFSDCEGVIGPKTSAKLARDFAEWQEKADAVDDDYFRELYAKWRLAFESAANSGAVMFH